MNSILNLLGRGEKRLVRMSRRMLGGAETPVAPATARVLARARAMLAEQRFDEAIELATTENRSLQDPLLERQLAQWRQLGGAAAIATGSGPSWPPTMADPFPDAAGLPEIHGLAALTAGRLGGGIFHHGGLIVRGLLAPHEVAEFTRGIDNAIDALEQAQRGRVTPETEIWYSRIPLKNNAELAGGRGFSESHNGVWTADSPRMLCTFIELIKTKGIDRIIGELFGERPLLSVGKSTLRRVPPQPRPSDWHQDGAFLGTETRTVNMWLSLSHCGDDAAGLDLVPRRLPGVLETGTQGACFDWSVGNALAETTAAGQSTASPLFGPGDAVFFDQLLLHRTPGNPGLKRDRYAIENWFFAPSTFPTMRGALLI
jgi:hypothetical protein